MLSKLISDVFGSHRNFITHSVLNPIFLMFIIIAFIVSKNVNRYTIGMYISVLIYTACDWMGEMLENSKIQTSLLKKYQRINNIENYR